MIWDLRFEIWDLRFEILGIDWLDWSRFGTENGDQFCLDAESKPNECEPNDIGQCDKWIGRLMASEKWLVIIVNYVVNGLKDCVEFGVKFGRQS